MSISVSVGAAAQSWFRQPAGRLIGGVSQDSLTYRDGPSVREYRDPPIDVVLGTSPNLVPAGSVAPRDEPREGREERVVVEASWRLNRSFPSRRSSSRTREGN